MTRLPKCPFLGACWDRGTHHSYATDDNRCFATVTTKRVLVLLKKEVPGGHISLGHQKKFCFSEFAYCTTFIGRGEATHTA